MKAALSFAFGGLVVFVPQGVKTQEKKPAKDKVEIVEVQEVAEPSEVEIVELRDLTKPLEVEIVELQELTEPVEILDLSSAIVLSQIQERVGERLSKRDLVEIAKVMHRLDALKVQVMSLDGETQQLDRSLVRLQGEASRKGGKAHDKRSEAELHRRLAKLESQRVSITDARGRLLAQVASAQRALARIKADQAIEANRRATDRAVQRSAARAQKQIRSNALRAQEQVQCNVDRAKEQYYKALKAQKTKNYGSDFELPKLQAELQAKAVALEALKRRDTIHAWSKKGPAAQDKQAVAKLEREIVRLTRELASLKARPGRALVTRVPTPPGPSAPGTGRRSGGWRNLGPRSSGSRRSAPSTLGVEGKVIWNELQGIRGEIRTLRKLLEAHMKSGSRKTRTGSARRGSVGRRHSSGKTRSGVTSSRTGYLSLPVGKEFMGSDGKTFQVTKGMTYFLENGQLHASPVPDFLTTDPLDATLMPMTIPFAEFWFGLATSNAPRSRGSEKFRTHPWGSVPGKRRAAPPPATPPAPALPPVHEHKKHKGHDKKKSKARRGSVIYWGGADAVPAPRASKKNELHRL